MTQRSHSILNNLWKYLGVPASTGAILTAFVSLLMAGGADPVVKPYVQSVVQDQVRAKVDSLKAADNIIAMKINTMQGQLDQGCKDIKFVKFLVSQGKTPAQIRAARDLVNE
jgi:hypothetical protein